MTWESRFLTAARRRGLRESTVLLYEKRFRLFRGLGVDLNNAGKRDLEKIVDYYSKRKRSYYRETIIFIREVLKFLNRDKLLGVVEIPRQEKREERIREQIIDDEDVKKLIDKAPNLEDRLLIELLYESGARIGEIDNLRIKDVQFDEHSGILWLRGKTKPRNIRVYAAVPDLKKWLNEHPDREDPEARLFHVQYWTLGVHLRKLGRKILGRNVHPHMFRHTRATLDSKYFTDREMMMRFGWDTPATVGIYSHLSMKDVDDKDLVLHGKKLKEDILKPLLKVRKCPHCKEDNAPVALFCHKCSRSLTRQDMTDKELKAWIMKMVREAK